jgi:hypothetical protein
VIFTSKTKYSKKGKKETENENKKYEREKKTRKFVANKNFNKDDAI